MNARRARQQRKARQIQRAKQQATRKPVTNTTNEDARLKAANYKIDASKWDYTCYLIAGGPSLLTFNWDLLTEDKFVVAINRAYEKCPTAQIIYYTDADYEQRHLKAMREHGGQLMRGVLHPGREKKHEDVILWHLTGAHGYDTKPGCLKHGSNSTHAAINMCAAHLGFKKIYVLGLDMKWGRRGDKKTSHWHDGHRRIDPESGYRKMSTAHKLMAPYLQQAGVEVYNCNPASALDAYKKIPMEQAFEEGAKVWLAPNPHEEHRKNVQVEREKKLKAEQDAKDKHTAAKVQASGAVKQRAIAQQQAKQRARRKAIEARRKRMRRARK